jgi:hypothetical protein
MESNAVRIDPALTSDILAQARPFEPDPPAVDGTYGRCGYRGPLPAFSAPADPSATLSGPAHFAGSPIIGPAIQATGRLALTPAGCRASRSASPRCGFDTSHAAPEREGCLVLCRPPTNVDRVVPRDRNPGQVGRSIRH